MQKTIYTIGHSTRTFDEFLELLHAYSIEMLVDVRSYPGSRRYPHFNKEKLAEELPSKNILYKHIPALGGRRKVSSQSKNTVWKNNAFRGYADYMETGDFKKGIEELEKTASTFCTAFMCSEAVWWRCHRSMISDYLKVRNWKVLHIMTINKSEEHPFTAPAKIINGQLYYGPEQMKLL